MEFLVRRKRFRFAVGLTMEKLSAVPFVTGILFCKIRVRGSSFSEVTSREEVRDHCVRWRKKSRFTCSMSADPVTGVLEPCVCRVSVRKEVKGGKEHVKLGYAELDVAQFAGCGQTVRRCLLEGYSSRSGRQDNSILELSISVQLLSGDPCFKRPSPIAADEDQLGLDSKGDDGNDTKPTSPRRPTSLRLPGPRSHPPSRDSDSTPDTPEDSVFLNRRRLLSAGSQCSETRGSGGDGRSVCLTDPTHRQPGPSGTPGPGGHPHVVRGHEDPSPVSPTRSFRPGVLSGRSLRRRRERVEISPCRLTHSRVDANDIVDDIIRSQDFTSSGSAEESRLTLFVGRDGSTALGGAQGGRWAESDYKAVVIEGR
uniref:C2 NT-type domain-containing protein n=1 Tax=Callorhinchus milii TaxID=7868 RepID=V9L206_CALMI